MSYDIPCPYSHFTLREISPGTQCTGDWVGPKAALQKIKKNLLPIPEMEHQFLGDPACITIQATQNNTDASIILYGFQLRGVNYYVNILHPLYHLED